MTTSERKAQTNSAEPSHPAVQPERHIPNQSPDSARRPTVLHGRPRSVEGEEAYVFAAHDCFRLFDVVCAERGSCGFAKTLGER